MGEKSMARTFSIALKNYKDLKKNLGGWRNSESRRCQLTVSTYPLDGYYIILYNAFKRHTE
jgi:hypothetical protein